jgi:HSP20 family protein
MVLRRANGTGPAYQLRNEVDRLVHDFFHPTGGGFSGGRTGAVPVFPPLNAWENTDTTFIEAELPGVKSEDLEISVEGNLLTIRGRRNEETAEGMVYHRQERGIGEFTRVLRLNADVNPAGVEATLKAGVLLVKLPRAESAKPKKIQVRQGN